MREPVDDKQFRDRIVGGEAILKTLSRVMLLASSTFVRECLGLPIFERELQNVTVARGQTSQLRETRAFELDQILVFFGIVGLAMDLSCHFSLLAKRRHCKQRCTEHNGQDAHGTSISHPVENIASTFARSLCLAKPLAAL